MHPIRYRLIFLGGIHYHSRMRHIFHPTDQSPESRDAFVHALRLAVAARGRLSLLRLQMGGSATGDGGPGVRRTLEQWGLLPPGSPRDALGGLGLEVSKAVSETPDPVHAALAYLRTHPADLIVLAGGSSDGRARWLQRAVSEPIAREARQLALFLPYDVTGFVSGRDGSVTLRNLLVPIAHHPEPSPALEAACRVARLLGCEGARVTLLYVGEADDAPAVSPPADSTCVWERIARPGDPVETILDTAEERLADLVVMPTAGKHGFLDLLRGSTTERVLRRARRPVLAVPIAAGTA
jgi:nucleotide-binding universal stress UspA family protein